MPFLRDSSPDTAPALAAAVGLAMLALALISWALQRRRPAPAGLGLAFLGAAALIVWQPAPAALAWAVLGAVALVVWLLAGRHARRDLMTFGVPMRGEMRFTRLDNGRSVEVSHHLEAAPRPAQLGMQMQAALAPQADSAQREAFAQTWQGWVRAILVDHADDPELIKMED